MVLEATMICVDNSDFMRNGDFVPTRLQAQQDAVNLVCHAKRQNNPENTVGLLTFAKTEVLSTLTTDASKVMAKLQQVQPRGDISFITGIRIAHLALRHRQSRNQRMRIVAFVGSPIEQDEKEIIKLAKRLKKEKVSVDIINFGEDEYNQSKLNAFIKAVASNEAGTESGASSTTGSHLVTVPAGTMLHDSLISSPVIMGEDGSGAMPGYGMEFGVDPNEDPELALALRVSMEDQRARQEAEATALSRREAGAGLHADMMFREMDAMHADQGISNEDVLLREALALSMQQQSSMDTDTVAPASDTGAPITTAGGIAMEMDFNAMTEDEQLNYALRMSMQADSAINATSWGQDSEDTTMMEAGGPASVKTEGEGVGGVGTDSDLLLDVMTDPGFLQSVLEQLPGVDPKSEEVISAVNQGQCKDDGAKKKKDEKK